MLSVEMGLVVLDMTKHNPVCQYDKPAEGLMDSL